MSGSNNNKSTGIIWTSDSAPVEVKTHSTIRVASADIIANFPLPKISKDLSLSTSIGLSRIEGKFREKWNRLYQ